MSARTDTTTKHIRALNRALKQELMLGQQQLAIAGAQTDALIANDARRLQAWVEEAREILARQEAVALSRQQAALELARALGMEGESDGIAPPLSQIVLRLPVEEAKRLLATRRQILAVDHQIQSVNERNRPLLENALDFVQFTIHALTGLALKPARYGANPNAVAAPTFYIDRKA